MNMNRRLIIDGNAVYEIDENCMLKKRIENEEKKEMKSKEQKKEQKKRVE